MDRERKTYSRREFLKVAGITGASLALAGGAGGVFAACGGTDETTTSGPTTTTNANTSSTEATTTTASTSTVSTSAEAGRPLKIGMVTPSTGALAPFALYDDWAIRHLGRGLKDGLVCGDGTVREVQVIKKDTQSDSSRAAAITGDLIQGEKVDVLVSSGAPDTTSPSADVAEAMGCPSISSAGPWQAFYFDRKPPEGGFRWTYGFLIGSEQTILNFSVMFDQVPNNKIVGMLLPNDADARGWMADNAAPAVFKEKGYTLVQSDWFTPGTEDYTTIIDLFKRKGCEIVCGTNTAPDFTNFWKQAYQQGYRPKLVSTGKALLFPQTLDALGDVGNGLLGETGWDRTFPYKDSLTGQTAEELWAEISADTDLQPGPASIGMYSSLEWVCDAFKRAANPEDKTSFIEAIKTTNNTFTNGKLDMTAPLDPTWHPVPNVYKSAFAGGQWRLTNGGKYKFELRVCAAETCPGLEVKDKVVPMTY